MKEKHQLTPTLKRFKCMWIITVILVLILLLFLPYRSKINPEIFKPPVPLPYRFCPREQTVHWDQESPFMPVTGTKTLLISAHLERRTEQKEVNVIAVVKRSEEVDYRCLFCCQGRLHIYKGVCNLNRDHFGFPYGTASIMCPVPLHCETPFQIAVTSAADDNEDEHHKVFLEVKHHKVDGHSFPYDFTVCISTMFDFTNVLQLVQSLEMLQLLGVNRVVIYKTSCSPEIQRILDYYTHKGLMEVIPWSMSRYLNVSRSHNPQLGPGDIHYFGQIPALNDCVYRYMYRSRYVALHDVDELILPQTVNSWLELLPLLEKKYGADKCYKFENNEFPIMPAPPPPQTLALLQRWKNVKGVNIFSYLYQQPKAKTQYSNFKIIVNPRAVYMATVHGLVSSQKGCAWVDRDIARLYHTRVQSELTHDKLIYDGRLLSFADKLVLAVDTVLRDTELLKDNMQEQSERNYSSNSVTVITLSMSVYLFVSVTCLSIVYSSVNVYTTF